EAITRIVDGGGDFMALGRPAINNDETLVFIATLDAGSSGIFVGPDPVVDRVIGEGDILSGSVISGVNFLQQTGLNNEGQFVFRANFADGSTGIFRADPEGSDPRPVPEPVSVLSLLAIGAFGMASRQRR
ncbi:MAG: PEP-CTERM sorting domain-containing protein, partial [Phormidesmis sp.]